MGVGTIFGRIGMAGGDNGMLLVFIFGGELPWPAKLLRRLILSSDSCLRTSGGGKGRASSGMIACCSTGGGGGKSGEGTRSGKLLLELLSLGFGGRSGTQSSIEMILPRIIGASKSFDKC